MKNLFSLFLIIGCFFYLSVNIIQAQQATATLTGVVTDQAGALIPGAIVTATNKATNLLRTVSTNNEGIYVISSLPVGNYDLDIVVSVLRKI